MLDRNQEIEQQLLASFAEDTQFAVRAFDEVSSTMDVAREWSEDEPLTDGEFRLVFAQKQTAGRGRRGRSWNSEAQGLYCTILANVSVPQEQLAGLSLVVGIATMRMLGNIAPGICGLKWPNDVLSKDGKKLSGTLIETRSPGKGNHTVFIGIGVNCRGSVAADIPACTLAEIGASEDEPIAVAALLMRELGVVLPRFFKNGFGIFRDEWLSRALYVNAEVSVVDDNKRTTGIVSGISREGALELRTREGNRSITVGDVEAV